MVSDHALKLAIRAQMDRYNRRAVRSGLAPLSYTQARTRFIENMYPTVEEMTAIRQEQVAAGISVLESGRDLIICGGTGSGKTTIAQAVSNRTSNGLYIASQQVEYGKELRSSGYIEWSEDKREQVLAADSACIDEIRDEKDLEPARLRDDSSLAVVLHAMHPDDAIWRLENMGLQRKWRNPAFLYCRWEDRLTDEVKREIAEKKARDQARLDSIQPIVNV